MEKLHNRHMISHLLTSCDGAVKKVTRKIKIERDLNSLGSNCWDYSEQDHKNQHDNVHGDF
jgi:hypothetical protein